MNRNTFFTYNWFVDDTETDITAIRVYGIGENNENICVRINDFTPYVYIELPIHIPWNDMKAQLLGNKIDEILKDHKPLKKCLMWKQRLYGAHLNEDGSRKKFPYLFCSFSNKNDYKSLSYTIQKKNIVVSGIGAVKLRMHEQDADPILQLTVAKDLPTSGWITFVGNLVPEVDKITLCDLEYKVNWKNMKKCDRATVGLPKIMGFDIEVNSSNPSAMPKAEKPEDKIFQISCVFSREGSSDYESHLLTLGDPVQSIVGEEAIIHRFLNEAELIVGFTELIRKENPNVIVGYNILNFDIPYMIERSKRPGRVNHIFDTLGFHKYNHAREKTIVWSSSAYKNQEFKFLDAEGRLFIDLLPLVKRDFKMDNYKLKTVSDFFIGETKDPLSVKGIFKCYRIGTKKELDGTYSEKSRKAISVVGRYCFTEDTLVSTVNGNIKISHLLKNNEKILSWNKNENKIEKSVQTNFFNNGIQDCVEIELIDGRKIISTPEHLFANENNDWVEARTLNNNSYVLIGPVMAEKNLDTVDMIFARLLGYVLSDGSVSKNASTIYIGNIFDANIIIDDIYTITGIKQNISYGKNCWIIRCPLELHNKIKNIEGVVCGNRTTNDCAGIPEILKIFNENEQKEFIAGLFGGDGSCTCLNRKENKFTPICLTSSKIINPFIFNFLSEFIIS